MSHAGPLGGIMSVEIIQDADGIRVIVTDGMSLPVADRLPCPTCGTAASYLIAWFTENMVRPVRSYQLLSCGHEFSTREYYLFAMWEADDRSDILYELRPLPEDRKYDPVGTAVETGLWRMAGSAESSREIFHAYGGE